MNALFFGDCLDVLREHIPNESVDLIYLDPPFNSKRDYSVLFKSHKGHESDAQITAFEDTWHWGEQAEREFSEILKSPNTDVAELMRALRSFLGENDMMAYLTMMANRLLELHRTLKSTGSLYLHCDPTASHYLKVVMDGVFGKTRYINEITWKRQSAHNDARKKFSSITDIILFYAKSVNYVFYKPRTALDERYVEKAYRYVDEEGRRYRLSDLRSPNPRPNLMYEYKGFRPHQNGWAVSREKMEVLDREGRLWFPTKSDGRIQLKRFLDENEGATLGNLWTDILPLHTGKENLGYPTQKPLALLERIISASSNEGDIILDPFCGCGTAVEAAHMLDRQWMGIDITHLAISLIEKRMKDAFGKELQYEVHGTPKDLDGARDLAERDKYQFQWWACSLVGAQPYQGKKKGSDGGIDGLIFFQDEATDVKKIIVSVKGGANVSVTMIRDLIGVLDREKAAIGIFVTLTAPTDPMLKTAIAAGFYESPHHGQFPRLQILTIEGLLEGREQPRFPDLSAGRHTFNTARKRTDNRTAQESLGI